MMNVLRQQAAHLKNKFLSEGILSFALIAVGAVFVAAGVRRFWVRPEPFTWVSILGCVAGAFGAFFILLVTDYVFHHAPLVFIPWFIVLIYFAFVQPHFAVGLGLASWFIPASEFVQEFRSRKTKPSA